MQQLVAYDAACRAVAQAKTIDDVKEIQNRAEAARAYARQAKNRQMEIDAVEIRVRAERRLGEILIDLRGSGALGKQGQFHGKNAAEAKLRLLTLDELGVDKNISGPAQRLALLSQDRFDSEVCAWRSSAETAQRTEIPLQTYRIPSIKGDRQRAAQKLGRKNISQNDPFDKFRAPDGRRIADWRSGELDRLIFLADRMKRTAEALRNSFSVANRDPLSTVEMIYEKESLLAILNAVWAETTVPNCNTGLGQTARIEESRKRRTRICEQCSKQFVMDSRGNTAGRFCSRGCSVAASRKKLKY